MSNRQIVLEKLREAMQALDDVIDPHESIIVNDDQYDDPELWWALPAKLRLLEAMTHVRED